VKLLLSDFSAVSTREVSGVRVCKQLGVESCGHVLDPTLLVDVSFYDRFLNECVGDLSERYILDYTLDGSVFKQGIVSELQSVLGLDVVSINTNSRLDIPGWLNKFRGSSFVFTDSFHGMIFSIIFNKNFVVVGNLSRGVSRFKSLLSDLGLDSRLLLEGNFDVGDLKSLMNADIDYESVNLKIKELRLVSSNFLNSSIS
jgi:hypothetical protein